MPRRSARGKAAEADGEVPAADDGVVASKKAKKETNGTTSTKAGSSKEKKKETNKVAKAGAAKGKKDTTTATRGGRRNSRTMKKEVKEEPLDDEMEEEEEESKPTKVIVKGKAPVDALSGKQSSHHVFYDKDEDTVWDCMLNQTHIQNNNNKYYLIQLLESDSGSNYCVWMRWGRVGYDGQNSLTPCGSDLAQAKAVFEKKFNDKTKNLWEERHEFEKVHGKYDLVKMDYNIDQDKDEEKKKSSSQKVKSEAMKKGPVTCELHPKVQALLELIGDIATMEQTVVEMEFDTKKAPLGKITTEQIKAGYAALKEISGLISQGKTSGSAITQACNDFYTRIPHEFGFKVPPVIRTMPMVKKKIELLEALGDIQVALKLLSDKDGVDEKHPMDKFYGQLDVNMNHLDNKHKDFRLIERYIQSTHGSTHTNYKMKLLDVFECTKSSEIDRFVDHGNRMLLFHGSRMSNWTGILSQGLRIAPPEAPITGYMFGKGVYFADMSSKSANYCWPTQTQNVGLLLLCEVSLGTPNEKLQADYAANELPSGTHSTKGVGRMTPDPKKMEKLSDGTVVPMGPVLNSSSHRGALAYNEFIVYDVAQIKMRYLAKIKFDFPKGLW